jgi:membrane AbrB-like protein
MTGLRSWTAAIAATAVVSAGFAAVHAPSPVLLGGVVGGIAAALTLRSVPDVPRAANALAQGVIGVAVGALVSSSTLHAIGAHWLPVVLVCAATLAISVVLGLVLAAVSAVDSATASAGMIAGGAAGMVSISDELGADDRLVLMMQYLRVLLIVAFMPLVATSVFKASSLHEPAAATSGGTVHAVVFALVCIVLGIPLGRLLRAPAAPLIGPMLFATAAAFLVPSLALPVPTALEDLALGVVGLQVGLRFTPASLRSAGSLLPITAFFVVVLVATCGLLGLLLGRLAHVDQLDAYLATTPGGLYVVLATAVTGHADAGFILSVQLLRTFLMLLAGPVTVRALVRWRTPALPAAE